MPRPIFSRKCHRIPLPSWSISGPAYGPTSEAGTGQPVADTNNGSPETAPAPAPAPAPTARPRKSAAALAAQRILDTAAVFKQAGDGTRLKILLMLLEGEQHVNSICAAMNQSQPAVSHHLALLRHGRIIQARREGKHNYYELTEAGEALARAAQAFVD